MFPRVYLWWPLRDGFIAEGLQGLHGSVVSGCLASASLTNKLMTPYRQLHIEDLRNRIMVPGIKKKKPQKNISKKRRCITKLVVQNMADQECTLKDIKRSICRLNLKRRFTSALKTDARERTGSNIMSQVINSHRLHHFQIKGPLLHQGQLLHNSLLANHLKNAVLLNLSSGMQNKAQGHISSLLSSCPKHRLFSLSLGPDRVGLSCHWADLEVCVCDTPLPGQ